jgi:hypothetical protein
MNIYLAAILGFCALTTDLVPVVLFPAQLLTLSQQTQPPQDTPQSGSPQQPPPNTPPVSPAQEPPQPNTQPKSEQSPPTSVSPAPDAAQELHPAQPEATGKKPASKARVSAKKHRRRKHTSATASGSSPEKKVVRNGGTADPAIQLAPGMSPEQASRQRQSTSQLLATTDANLKQISARQLSLSQQDAVSQTRKYMEQAKAAEDTGDVQRAHNLASKALLLSDDVVKH